MSQSPVHQYIEKAKSIPLPLYLLVVFNITMIVGFIFKEFTVLYMFGSLAFVIMLMAAIGRATGIWENPTQLISENVRERIDESSDKIRRIMTAIDLKQNDSTAMNILITTLFMIYMTAILNQTFEIFLIFNFAYVWVFLPKQTDGLIGIAKEQFSELKAKLKSVSHQ